MGDRREDAPRLKPQRNWPIVVRRARADDESAVLTFASATWHGWDYVPRAWPVWLTADDGALLVGTVGQPTDGSAPVDAQGETLEVGRPIAITRVAMVSPTEAWLEGIRVDPLVRGLQVASDLQVAELQWVAAQQATVLRYATGSSNEASHKLGARDGIELLVEFATWGWSATGSLDDDDEESAFDPEIRAATTARRRSLLAKLNAADMIATPADADILWARLDSDPTFNAGRRLYEPRGWAMQELTHHLFDRHVARGEVVSVAGDQGSAVAVFVDEQLPAEDAALRVAVLAGDGPVALTLLNTMRELAGEGIRLRLPPQAPLIRGREDAFRSAGWVSPDWKLHLLARPIDAAHPVPDVDPNRLLLADVPVPVRR